MEFSIVCGLIYESQALKAPLNSSIVSGFNLQPSKNAAICSL